VPPLPAGLVYVDVTAGADFSAARRSDGSVIAWGDQRFFQHAVPVLAPGFTFTQIAAGADFTVALFTSGGFNWSGDGCAGSNGRATLSALAPPRVGSTLQVEVAPPPSGPAVLITGFSNTQASFGPLPFDLSALGMPGCHLRVSPDVLLQVAGTPPHASLPIPQDPALTGLVFHQQALLLDPAANRLGAVLSGAATAVVGG